MLTNTCQRGYRFAGIAIVAATAAVSRRRQPRDRNAHDDRHVFACGLLNFGEQTATVAKVGNLRITAAQCKLAPPTL